MWGLQGYRDVNLNLRLVTDETIRFNLSSHICEVPFCFLFLLLLLFFVCSMSFFALWFKFGGVGGKSGESVCVVVWVVLVGWFCSVFSLAFRRSNSRDVDCDAKWNLQNLPLFRSSPT